MNQKQSGSPTLLTIASIAMGEQFSESDPHRESGPDQID